MGKILNQINKNIEKGNSLFFLLLDPDKESMPKMREVAENCEEAGVDAILVGSSFLISWDNGEKVRLLKENTKLPVILFPGGVKQLSPHADAILFLSLISGRNPRWLIEEHIQAAPIVKKFGLETIPTGYVLIESGKLTSVVFVSNTLPIPSDKVELVVAHCLAAEYLGMELVFLEAGSGAERPVPENIISEVKKNVKIPVMVGGGIKTPDTARKKVEAGADIIVVGDHFEKQGYGLLKEFVEAVHR
ncbi:geranylgeranylglyceryl/heptaprenylglyceryl phosphate synthase [bacterium]|nr:geranylgeranylglyceryl/heptaprenylglyceryl phosphate synthase [bacterium]